MAYLKFDLRKLEKLNDPARLEQLPPEAMWRAVGDPSIRVMVEIGAGTGFFARRFCRMSKHGLVYACDLEDTMIRWMRENLPEVAEGCVIPVKSEEGRVPLAGELARLVYMINLHHELVDPQAVYREALRLLEPSGRLLVVDWKKEETPKGPPVGVRAPLDALLESIRSAGFEEVGARDLLEWHNLVTATKPARES